MVVERRGRRAAGEGREEQGKYSGGNASEAHHGVCVVRLYLCLADQRRSRCSMWHVAEVRYVRDACTQAIVQTSTRSCPTSC